MFDDGAAGGMSANGDASPGSDGEAIGSPVPAPRPPRHRQALLVGAIVIAVVGVLVLAVRPVTAPAAVATHTPSPEPTGPVASLPAPAFGYITDRAAIEQRVAWARDGQEPFATSLQELIDFADAARLDDPRPKEPLNISGTDGPFVEDTAAAYGLGIAYVATDDAAYAQAAARYLMAWATTTRTTRNTCIDRGCQTSLIISRNVPGFVFAADLIASSGAMTASDETTFRAWLRDVILPTASERDNNWGDAGTFTRMALTGYLGDTVGFDAAVARWRAMIDFLPSDGHIPEEVRRGSSGIMYTQEALQYKVGSAVMAARRGIDLWDYQGAAGGSLRGSIDYLVSFFPEADHWPWHRRADFPTPGPMWELVYAHWPDARYVDVLTTERPFSENAHAAIRWTTITNGIPIVDDVAAPTNAP